MEYTVLTATVDDAETFIPLLSSLGYPNTLSSLKVRISRILENPDAVLLVASPNSSDKALGLLSLHFIPQLGVEGDVARIGFLVVDERCHGVGIGKLLELHAEKLSRERGCNRMVFPLTDSIQL
jgi:GNAT superfamily N-acetyltransferase